MRLKFLSAIASLLIFSVTVVSCLGNNDPVDYPVSSSIFAFELDSVYKGIYYKFTIDQQRGLIYNIDSVPHSADTIINKILVRNIETNYAYVTTGDTLFVPTDSIDFSKSMATPVKFKVISAIEPDKTREYSVSVRIHQQDPDSLVWRDLTDNFTSTTLDNQKIVSLSDNALIYTSSNDVYSSSLTNGKNWTHHAITGIPRLELSSVLNYNNMLYALSDKKVYSSEDGFVWTEISGLGNNVKALIAPFPKDEDSDKVQGIAGIINKDEKDIYTITNVEATTWMNGGDTIDENSRDFPIENISYALSATRTGIPRIVIVGTTENTTQTVAWSTEDGKIWGDLATDTEFALPAMKKPSIIYYNKRLYAYGGDFSTFYVSDDGGLIWKTINRKFMFLETFKGREDYSSFVDKDNYIWIVWTGKAGKYTNQVYKGRLNKLGFKIQ